MAKKGEKVLCFEVFKEQTIFFNIKHFGCVLKLESKKTLVMEYGYGKNSKPDVRDRALEKPTIITRKDCNVYFFEVDAWAKKYCKGRMWAIYENNQCTNC